MLKDLVNKAKDVLEDAGIDDLDDIKKIAQSEEAKKVIEAVIKILEKNDKDTVVKILKSIIK
ncbi:MAG: hypothetical protein J6E38_01080 [Clostridia bacterium]|nr:hypothetical protein [Clostridia bacterium]